MVFSEIFCAALGALLAHRWGWRRGLFGELQGCYRMEEVPLLRAEGSGQELRDSLRGGRGKLPLGSLLSLVPVD